jgi:hypothetical protein
MKAIMNKIFAALVLMTTLFACEENVRIPDFKNAPNVRIQLRATDNYFNLVVLPDSKLVYDIFSENHKELEEVEISFRYLKSGSPACNLGGCLGPFVVKTYTAADFSSKGIIEGEEITMAELIGIMGLTMGDIGGGDQFLFVNKTTMKDGRVYPSASAAGQDNVPGIYDTPGASFTGSFNGNVGCPFVIADLVGMYDVIEDAWELAAVGHTEVEVVAGPGTNQYTIKNAFGFGLDFICTVDPASGATTAAAQTTWDPVYWGFPAAYNPGRTACPATNFSTTFSCVGQINLNLAITVSAGSFGNWSFKYLKQ